MSVEPPKLEPGQAITITIKSHPNSVLVLSASDEIDNSLDEDFLPPNPRGTDFTLTSERKLRLKRESSSTQLEESKESWLFETIKTDERGLYTSTRLVPNKAALWNIQAFSIIPNFGNFKSRKVKVSKNFFVKIQSPSSARFGEIVRISVIVSKEFDKDDTENESTVDVTLTKSDIKDFDFLEKIEHCEVAKFNYLEKSQSVTLTSTSQYDAANFFIRPRKVGKLSFVVKSEDESSELLDETVLTMNVDPGEMTRQNISSQAIDLRKLRQSSIDVNLKEPDNSIAGSTSFEGILRGKLFQTNTHDITKLMYAVSHFRSVFSQQLLSPQDQTYKFQRSRQLAWPYAADDLTYTPQRHPPSHSSKGELGKVLA